MIKRNILIVFILVFSINKTSASEFTFSGIGTVSCSSFAELYRDNPSFIEILYFHWAQGFMSGINAHLIVRGMDSVDLNHITTESQKQFIRMYCQKNPLASYVQAVTYLYDQMGQQQDRSDWRQ